MENIIKISDTEVKVEKTIVESEVVNLDALLYDKDSLERTIINNNNENARINAEIQSKISELEAKIAQVQSLGVVTKVAFELANPVVIEEATSTPEII